MWGIDAAGFVALLGTVATLVVLEGLLSADNALVLAVMVRHLPKHQQKRALRYGMLGAFVFRLIAVVFASTLLQYWIFKVVGGVYLLYIAISHLVARRGRGRRPSGGRGSATGFWGTVDRRRGDRHRLLDRLDPRGGRHGRGLPERLGDGSAVRRSPAWT